MNWGIETIETTDGRGGMIVEVWYRRDDGPAFGPIPCNESWRLWILDWEL